MKKVYSLILILMLSLLFASCSSSSDSTESTEPVYESSELAWYEMLGDWDQANGDNYLELHDDDTFYDSRYDLTGTWDESQDEGDVVFYYNGVPDYILDQGWDESEQYYECFGYDYSQGVMFDPETNEARWIKH